MVFRRTLGTNHGAPKCNMLQKLAYCQTLFRRRAFRQRSAQTLPAQSRAMQRHPGRSGLRADRQRPAHVVPLAPTRLPKSSGALEPSSGIRNPPDHREHRQDVRRRSHRAVRTRQSPARRPQRPAPLGKRHRPGKSIGGRDVVLQFTGNFIEEARRRVSRIREGFPASRRSASAELSFTATTLARAASFSWRSARPTDWRGSPCSSASSTAC